MTKTVRVNIRTAINASGIRRERRDGRDYIIVPSATLPDGVVMNRIRYPADEIAKSYASLENTPAPLGHPKIEGAFVSASDPEGLARGWIGAWNRNVRRENGRVFVDKVIDVATASQLEGGKAVLNAIEKGEAIHTSTGLVAVLTALENDADADWTASGMVFDHDAILLGEDGAATPAQGVGMMVNAAKAADGEVIDVVNSDLAEQGEREIDWGLEQVLRGFETKERAPLLERIKAAIEAIIRGAPNDDVPGSVANAENVSMDKVQFDELSGKVAALAEGLGGIDDKFTELLGNALKPITERLEAISNAEGAKAAAEKAELVNKVVEAELLTKEVAEAADVAVLNALLEKADVQAPAYRVGNAFKPTAKDSGFKLPKGE